jgi:hypothetical protein
VDARRGRTLQRLGGALDVGGQGARQAAHAAVADGLGDALHRREIPGAGGRETGFDHVHAQFFQRLGDAQFLFAGHGGARALLAVAQCGVENDQVLFGVGHGLGLPDRATVRRSQQNEAARVSG